MNFQKLSTAAISVTTVSKCYQVYSKPLDRLRQSLNSRLHRAVGIPQRRFYEEFWALAGISLRVEVGQTVGIIGRNGSGKSTLLQIICGTLSPTSGDVAVKGRVAALLELGSGFNPEFTGRENVYLNAAVLGLGRSQVEERFSEIEAFADIGGFIDQPVKTYSSGMVVRLAFAVIAHVDADILVVDEALAVGDAAFSQKCMRFLREFKANGTVLFVSHDASSILNLCDHAIWLDRGSLRMEGDPVDVSNAYTEYTAQQVYGDAVKLRTIRGAKDHEVPHPATLTSPPDSIEIFDNIANSDGWDTGDAKILSVTLTNLSRPDGVVFSGGERVDLRIRAKASAPLSSPIIGFFVKDRLGQSLFGEHTFLYEPGFRVEAGGVLEACFVFTLPLLPDGDYSMTVSIADGDPNVHVQHHWLHDAVMIRVASPVLRYGLVGIPYEAVSLQQIDDE